MGLELELELELGLGLELVYADLAAERDWQEAYGMVPAWVETRVVRWVHPDIHDGEQCGQSQCAVTEGSERCSDRKSLQCKLVLRSKSQHCRCRCRGD